MVVMAVVECGMEGFAEARLLSSSDLLEGNLMIVLSAQLCRMEGVEYEGLLSGINTPRHSVIIAE